MSNIDPPPPLPNGPPSGVIAASSGSTQQDETHLQDPLSQAISDVASSLDQEPSSDSHQAPPSQDISDGSSFTFSANQEELLLTVENLEVQIQDVRKGPYATSASGALNINSDWDDGDKPGSDQSSTTIDVENVNSPAALPQPTTSGTIFSAGIIPTTASSSTGTSTSPSIVMSTNSTFTSSPVRVMASVENSTYPGERFFPAPPEPDLATENTMFPIVLQKVLFRVREDRGLEVHHRENLFKMYVIPYINLLNGAKVQLFYQASGASNHVMLPNWRVPNSPHSAWLVKKENNYFITMHPAHQSDTFDFEIFTPDESERLLDGYFQPTDVEINPYAPPHRALLMY